MVKSPSRQSGDPAAHQPDTDAVSGLPAAAMAGTAPESFEVAMGELEQLVQRMEGGALSLEQSLAAYRRGAALSAGAASRWPTCSSRCGCSRPTCCDPFEADRARTSLTA